MPNECLIRRMTLADVDAVAAIEAATFPTPWSADAFRQELTRNAVARYLVAEADGRVIGFAGAWIILDESHITNIAVLSLRHPGGAQIKPDCPAAVQVPGLRQRRRAQAVLRGQQRGRAADGVRAYAGGRPGF